MILQVWTTFLLWVSPIRLWLAHRSDTNRHMDALRHGHHVSVAKPGRSKWRWNGGVVKTARWRKKQRWFMICDFVGVVLLGKRLIQKASWLLFGLHRFLCDKVGQLLQWMDIDVCCWKFTSNKVYEMCCRCKINFHPLETPENSNRPVALQKIVGTPMILFSTFVKFQGTTYK